MQEYARSGRLKEIVLISNTMLEKSIGEMAIGGYDETLNQAIVNTLHMINVFTHSEPIIGNFLLNHQKLVGYVPLGLWIWKMITSKRQKNGFMT